MKNMQTSKLFIDYLDIKDNKLIPNYSISSTDVVIYTIYLPDFIGLKFDLVEFLNEAELDRAQRFHRELDKTRFIIYRSILKFVLAAHTNLDAKNIHLDYHFNKKPFLASHPNLHFNISHSKDFAVIAVSHSAVGIDIEYISEDFNFIDLLPDIFDDNEIMAIQTAVSQKHSFYTSWTRKEAFVKALGKGIDDDFKDIPCLDGEHAINSALLKTAASWHMHSFTFLDQYLAAVAYENLSLVSKNLILFTIPNTMDILRKMTQVRKY